MKVDRKNFFDQSHLDMANKCGITIEEMSTAFGALSVSAKEVTENMSSLKNSLENIVNHCKSLCKGINHGGETRRNCF